jgi:hypothetical protein
MRRIIEIIVIAVFLLTISYVGWILFDKISNRSKREANENNAIKVIKKINQAQSDAKNRFGKYLSLEELSEKNLIDSEIKSGKSSGYNFSIKSEGEKYSVLASPNPGEGNLSFYSDESGVIRSSYKLIAGPNDPPSAK